MSAIRTTVPLAALVSTNGKQHPRRPRIEVRRAAASPEEAAAIAVAIEHFLRDTAPAPQPPISDLSPWLRAGLHENAGLDPSGRGPWGGAPW
jgi:hypothetical protein